MSLETQHTKVKSGDHRSFSNNREANIHTADLPLLRNIKIIICLYHWAYSSWQSTCRACIWSPALKKTVLIPHKVLTLTLTGDLGTFLLMRTLEFYSPVKIQNWLRSSKPALQLSNCSFSFPQPIISLSCYCHIKNRKLLCLWSTNTWNIWVSTTIWLLAHQKLEPINTKL